MKLYRIEGFDLSCMCKPELFLRTPEEIRRVREKSMLYNQRLKGKANIFLVYKDFYCVMGAGISDESIDVLKLAGKFIKSLGYRLDQTIYEEIGPQEYINLLHRAEDEMM